MALLVSPEADSWDTWLRTVNCEKKDVSMVSCLVFNRFLTFQLWNFSLPNVEP